MLFYASVHISNDNYTSFPGALSVHRLICEKSQRGRHRSLVHAFAVATVRYAMPNIPRLSNFG